jgi:pyridoxine kinase
VAQVKGANGKALYACDPVIGDVGRGVFVRPGIPEFMRDRAIPMADLVTPNQFELEFLTGLPVATLADAKAAVAALRRAGPSVVLLTSMVTAETPDDAIDMLAADGSGFWRVRTPKLGLSVNGAGDAIMALFFVHYARTRSAPQALGEAAASIHGLLRRTLEAGSREILTVAAQEEFVAPSARFAVEAL